ncbi:1,2-phenylacetyl-CoA epoxidase subunit PaaD [Laceyella putida]|uniref:1,2-phenylacetyl-CoA epoxidase subunit PaaD n=1 Tax=Laceyella putida TaxID=110101 RepID=A0ABW2RHC4_9BACL
MMTEADCWKRLQEVKDPEIPTVSVVEMGMVHEVEVMPGRIRIAMMPTFVGCPALEQIREQVIRELSRQSGVNDVEVTFIFDPPWTSDRITSEGARKLKEFGIAPPGREVDEFPPCPYCGEEQGEVENLFGPTACRAIYYCKRCRQPFEGMKKV